MAGAVTRNTWSDYNLWHYSPFSTLGGAINLTELSKGLPINLIINVLRKMAEGMEHIHEDQNNIQIAHWKESLEIFHCLFESFVRYYSLKSV